jgi:hypothetical protein
VQGTLQFKAISYIDEPTAQLRQAAYAEKKTDALVGRNDVARPAGAIAAPVQQAQISPPVQTQQVQPQIPFAQTATPAAPTGTGAGFATQPATSAANWPPQQTQQVQQPGPFAPTPAAGAGSPGQFQQNAAPTAGTTSPSEQPAPGKRRRRTAAEMQAANGAGVVPGVTVGQPGAPQAPFPHPSQQANAGQTQFPQSNQSGALPGQTDMGFGIAEGQPAAANPELAGMLDDFFKQG